MKRSQELAEAMGDDAVEALNNNGTWEYQPETIECGNWNPYWCSDCDTWHQEWYMFGYRIEDGHMFEVIHTCDTDGNWETNDEYDVDDPDYERWNAQYGYEETLKASKAYSEHVAETGDDPLGEFFVTTKTKVRYQVIVRYDNGFWFNAAKPVDSKDWNSDESQLPERLRDFLQLDGKRITDLDWTSINEFAEKAHLTEVLRVSNGECEFIEEIEVPRPEEDVKKDIIAAAKRSLSFK